MDADVFGLFWENSKLNRVTITEFGERIAAHPSGDRPPQLEHPGQDIRLFQPSDSLVRSMQARRSSRSWGLRPLSLRQLGSVLAGLSASPQGTRLYPSAGSTYALETYVICLRVERLEPSLCHYNGDDHSLTRIGPPPAADWRAVLNLAGEGQLPQAVVVFTALTERTTARYGARGGRFVLLEAGHAAQNVCLRAAHEGLAAVELGGLLDDDVARLLGIGRLGGRVILGIALGPGLR